MAVARVSAQMTGTVRQMPPGTFPGNVLEFDAASLPVLQVADGEGLVEKSDALVDERGD